MSLINNMLKGLNKETVKVKVLEDDPDFISVKNLKHHIHNQLGFLLFLLAFFVVVALGFIRHGFIENNDEHLIIGFKKHARDFANGLTTSMPAQALIMAPTEQKANAIQNTDRMPQAQRIKPLQNLPAVQSQGNEKLDNQTSEPLAGLVQSNPHFDLSYNALEMKEADKIASISEQGQDELSRLLALSYVHMNRTDDAIKILVKTLPDIKTDQEHYILLAALYQKSMLHQKALEIYWKLVETYPADGKSWAGLAISLEAIGEKKEALAAFKRAKLARNLHGPIAVYVNDRIRLLK